MESFWNLTLKLIVALKKFWLKLTTFLPNSFNLEPLLVVMILTWVIINHTTKPSLNARCSTDCTLTQAWFIHLAGKTCACITLWNICYVIGRVLVNEKEWMSSLSMIETMPKIGTLFFLSCKFNTEKKLPPENDTEVCCDIPTHFILASSRCLK